MSAQFYNTMIPDTGSPKWPYRNFLGLFLLISLTYLITGCANDPYRPVPECVVVAPPNPTVFIEAMPDERLVLMSSTYIKQIREVNRCNDQIRRINISNQVKDQ